MDRCAKVVPDSAFDERAHIWNNWGLIKVGLNNLDDADKFLRKSLEAEPKQVEARNNLALVEVHKCNPEAAVKWADSSLAIKEGQKDVLESRGYACLMKRQWKEGWEGYEAAVGNSKYRLPRAMGNEPYWDGTKGKKLYIRGEQGLGDEILFASCIPDALKENNIVLECDKRLAGLFSRSFDCPVFGTRNHKDRGWVGEFDYHTLIGSLPNYYRQSSESFPGTPYLKPDPERVLQWKTLVDTLPGLKVGLAWTGGLRNTFAHRRSLSLSQLSPILNVAGCSFISLQYKATEEHPRIKHWARGAEAHDLDEVAALIESLDLVISVSTATVHIAGGLGKECWVMVPKKPHWHYALEGDTLPWYKSVKLFRQSKEGEWSSVVQQIGELLASRVSGSSGKDPRVRMLGLDAVPHEPGLREFVGGGYYPISA